MAGLLASCTTASGPGLKMAAPSQGTIGVASIMAEVVQSEADTVAVADAVGRASAGAGEQQPASAAIDTGVAETSPAQLVAVLPEIDSGANAPDAASAEDGQKPASETSTDMAAAKKPDPRAQDVAPAATAPEQTPSQTAQEPLDATSDGVEIAVKTEQKKRGFLAAFFSAPAAHAPSAQSSFAPAAAAPLIEQKPLIEPQAEEKAAPIIDLSSKESPMQLASAGGEALPGVRQSSLFEIKHKSGIDDDSDVDLHEDVEAPVVLASAAGLARLAPNGLLKQRESVDLACLKPALVSLLKSVERHYGKRMVVTSGYRSPGYNKRVRGARRSQHMYCAAADVQMPGVSKWELAKFVRSMAARGGVGTYCHTESVHIDVGPERDWNWRCSRRKS